MNKWLIALAGFCVIMFTLLIILLVTGDGRDDNRMYVYFFNPYTRRMEAETRPLPHVDTQIQRAVEHLYSPPNRAGTLVSIWPDDIAAEPEDLINAVKLNDSTLFAFFSPVFFDIPPLRRSLFKAAFIYTMDSLPTVSEIKIVVTEDYNFAYEMLLQHLADEDSEYDPDEEDEYPLYMPHVIYDSNHAGVLIDPLDPPISPHWIDNYTFNHLHFADVSHTGLVVESRYVEGVNRQQEQMAMEMLELLIDGPHQDDAIALIPPETRVLSVDFVGTDIFVNLSGDFALRFTGGRDLAYLMIYSIVNTLLAEFTFPTRVQFLIDAQTSEEFHGVTGFYLGFARDDARLLSYIEAQRLEQRLEQELQREELE